MSTTSATSNGSVQQLIDQRLDALDRALLGLLSRNERLAIVAQVETRIRESASTVEASLQGATERATLVDAARMGEAAEVAPLPSAWQSLTAAAGRKTSANRLRRSGLAISSGVLGIVALALLILSPITYFAIAFVEPDETVAIFLAVAHVAAVAIGGAAAVVLGIVALVRLNRRAGQLLGHGWAITGLCTGPLPMFVGGLIALVTASQFLDMESVSVSVVQTETVPANGPPMAVPDGVPPVPVGVAVPQIVPQYYAAPSTTVPMAVPSYAPAAVPVTMSLEPIACRPAASSTPDVCAEECLRQEQAAFGAAPVAELSAAPARPPLTAPAPEPPSPPTR